MEKLEEFYGIAIDDDVDCLLWFDFVTHTLRTDFVVGVSYEKAIKSFDRLVDTWMEPNGIGPRYKTITVYRFDIKRGTCDKAIQICH